jgi:HNH endonuclease
MRYKEKLVKQIRHAPDYCIYPDGRIWSNKEWRGEVGGRFLKPRLHSRGYHHIGLLIMQRIGPKKLKYYFVHRLVAMHYVDGYEEGLQVNHIDGNKQNNHFTNLEWVTGAENMKHAVETGLKGFGKPYLFWRKDRVNWHVRWREGGRRRETSTGTKIRKKAEEFLVEFMTNNKQRI